MRQQSIIERVREIEELARKFHEVEASILSILNFRGFFETLLSKIAGTFEIPQVSFALIEESELAGLVREAVREPATRRNLSFVRRSEFESLLGGRLVPLLVNEGLQPYLRLFPAATRGEIRSAAIVPLQLDGELVGSLNHADPSATRFQPGLNAVFLERLGLKVSLCLSNVTAHEQLVFAAQHDPLTNLLNRRVMDSVLAREFARARRYNGTLSLVFLDLDDFKLVNDSFGHDCGDRLLQHIARLLERLTRSSDLVIRFAGDEFVLILPETAPRDAVQLMGRVQTALQKNPFRENGIVVPTAISFGIASTLEEDLAAAEQLVKRADQRLYRFKDQKKRPAEELAHGR
ncbi:GGDEF domain-containing protein [Desulfuromonas versatilis]|uniref:GGDEF domain-containing protein n=1 Tax=Desulfuromonas versatilis TaxID=2802975 RepID=A0ABM8HPU8_9BACT|nr:GGDEF domain-containing protein [Desulfuromonas versatilis]BCR03754.1 GGDEF domain-containing protein [Desulfuromonas versatilis]